MTAGCNQMTAGIKKRIAEKRGATNSDDGLSGLAPLLRVRPEFQEFCRFGSDWTSPHGVAQGGCAYFHIPAANARLMVSATLRSDCKRATSYSCHAAMRTFCARGPGATEPVHLSRPSFVTRSSGRPA